MTRAPVVAGVMVGYVALFAGLRWLIPGASDTAIWSVLIVASLVAGYLIARPWAPVVALLWLLPSVLPYQHAAHMRTEAELGPFLFIVAVFIVPVCAVALFAGYLVRRAAERWRRAEARPS
jgi:general stress protein CsbA